MGTRRQGVSISIPPSAQESLQVSHAMLDNVYQHLEQARNACHLWQQRMIQVLPLQGIGEVDSTTVLWSSHTLAWKWEGLQLGGDKTRAVFFSVSRFGHSGPWDSV